MLLRTISVRLEKYSLAYGTRTGAARNNLAPSAPRHANFVISAPPALPAFLAPAVLLPPSSSPFSMLLLLLLFLLPPPSGAPLPCPPCCASVAVRLASVPDDPLCRRAAGQNAHGRTALERRNSHVFYSPQVRSA